jgi:glycerol-3-phosphate dehydrogenase
MDKHVVIIGAGLFGLSTAIILAEKGIKVTVLEKSNNFMKGASLVNQNRIHYGYHYPRSLETGKESLYSMQSFLDYYGDCVVPSYKNYYAISKYNSKITSDDFVKFCKEINISLKESWPQKNILNKNMIDQVWEVYEPSFDYNILRLNISKRLSKLKNITLIRNAKISSINKINDSDIEVNFSNQIIKCNFLINASYASLKEILSMVNNNIQEAKFQLVALPILRWKKPQSNFGITVMDGNFCSLIPKGNSKEEFILSHVKKSVIETQVCNSKPTFKPFYGNIEYDIINESKKYFPILSKMECIDSWITTKMVLPNQKNNDARPSIVLEHEDNIFSIFSGKITTCISSATEIYNKINK